MYRPLLLLCLGIVAFAGDPLPSWRDGTAKQAIIAFVERTRIGGPEAIPAERRLAVFDNDGTLWSEQPMYVQAAFAIDRVKALAPQHPEWAGVQPYAGILAGDLKTALAGGEKALVAMVMATHAGITVDEFQQIVRDWLATARHPRTNRPYTAMVYQPMLEVMAYLRANAWRTCIVSGGGVEFMRVFAQEAYGVTADQVVGSSIKTTYAVRDGKPVLVREPELAFNDDKGGKPVAINLHFGVRPAMAFGNSDGDFAMLEWTTAGPGPSFGLLVHHTDAAREAAYDRASHVGRLERGLDEGPGRGWTIVDMAKDWATVFPPQP